MWHFTKIDVDINEVISEEHAEVSHAALTLALLPCARTKLIVCSCHLGYGMYFTSSVSTWLYFI